MDETPQKITHSFKFPNFSLKSPFKNLTPPTLLKLLPIFIMLGVLIFIVVVQINKVIQNRSKAALDQTVYTRAQTAEKLVATFSLSPVTPEAPTFEDVPKDHPSYTAIETLWANQITRGCSETPRKFCPDEILNRGALLTFMLRGAHLEPDPEDKTPRFTDVAPNHPLFDYIQLGGKLGISLGCSQNPPKFCPDEPGTQYAWDSFLERITNRTQINKTSPYKVGAYYFGIFSAQTELPDWYKQAVRTKYGGSTPIHWAGVVNLYGREPGIVQEISGWTGDFSHLKPYIGYYDQAETSVVEKHIAQAKEHGLSFFNFYWYWENNKEIHNQGLDSFLKAKNKNDLEFMLSFIGDYPSVIPKEALPTVIDTIVTKYFSQSNYMKTKSGQPILFYYHTIKVGDGSVAQAEEFITQLKSATKQKMGVEPFVLGHFHVDQLRKAKNVDGFTCLIPGGGTNLPYNRFANDGIQYFDQYDDKPLMPCATHTIDERARFGIGIFDRKTVRYVQGFTPQLFEQHLRNVKTYMDSQSSEMSKILTIYAWNEWHEGGIIEPNVRDGNLYLRTINSVFNLTAIPPSAYPAIPQSPIVEKLTRATVANKIVNDFGLALPNVTQSRFQDIPANHRYLRQIEALAVNGITGGCSINPTRFCPDDAVIRSSAVTLILRAIKRTPTAIDLRDTTARFTDVSSSHPLFSYIQLANKLGLDQGCSQDPVSFCPNQPITEAEWNMLVQKAKSLQ